MKRYTSLWALLKDVIFGCPEQKQEERLDQAVFDHAELSGDVQFAHMMYTYYVRLAMAIDKERNWWGYANAKQKAQDFKDQYDELVEKRTTAAARVDAERARLQQIRNSGEK